MPKSFWTEISVSVIAAAGAAIAYRADIEYLPSLLVIVSALMVTGIFAEIEDHLIVEAEAPDTPDNNKYLLSFVRIIRSTLLLVMGIAAIALVL